MNLFIILPISLFIGVVCGLFGTYAGAHGTSLSWRRIGIPVLLIIVSTLTMLLFGYRLALLGLLSYMLYAIGVGYGIPDLGYPDDPDADSGSSIGRMWWNIFCCWLISVREQQLELLKLYLFFLFLLLLEYGCLM